MEILEKKFTRNNIVIFGLAEQKDKSVHEQVVNVIQNKLNISLPEQEINCIYRFGNTNSEKPRPVKVELRSLRKAKDLNLDAKIVKNTLIVDGQEFTVKQLIEKEIDEEQEQEGEVADPRTEENTTAGTSRKRAAIEEPVSNPTQNVHSSEEINELLRTNNRNLKILHVNIRSIKKNIDKLNIFLNSLETEFDIIVLSETWLIESTKLYEIPNFDLIYSHGNINQNDGVLIVNIYTINAIQIELSHTKRNITITALYRPPSTCVLSFLDHLGQYLENFIKNDERIHYLVGDININIMSDNCEVASNYLNLMAKYGFKSYINKYTRVQRESKSCLDHIFVKDPNLHYIINR
nr:unnamed protein product [Callosobruchus analis]